MKRTKLRKYSKAKLPLLKRKLWIVFSKYIRQRDNYTCFTCGKVATGASCHAGHFIPRAAGGLALFFHEDNVHAQCATCNLFLQGNTYEYGKRLGDAKVQELQALRKRITQWGVQDYLDKIAHYESLL